MGQAEPENSSERRSTESQTDLGTRARTSAEVSHAVAEGPALGGSSATSPEAAGPRPFRETVDTAGHVERRETARVLLELERNITRAHQTGALVASPGLGRTHLLRVLSERTDPIRWQCVYVPQARFDFADLCRYCVAAAGGRHASEAPDVALRGLLHETWSEGRSLLFMIDDADSMPEKTAQAWLDFTFQHVPTLVSLFVTRDDVVAPCVAALDELAPIVRFSAPMSEAETSDYLLGRLSHAGLGSQTLGRFSEPVIERLHALSEGVPVRLNALAQAYLDMPGETPEVAWGRFIDWSSRLLEPATAVQPAETAEAEVTTESPPIVDRRPIRRRRRRRR